MPTQSDSSADARIRFIDEEALVREAKALAMSGARNSPEVRVIRGLLTLLQVAARANDPEYKHSIWGKDED